jgi:galactonate dehydratase
VLPDRPGWGTEPNEEAIRTHPPKGQVGLVSRDLVRDG